MEAAWRLVVDKHEILRTAFIVAPQPYNDVVQLVLRDTAFDLGWSHNVFPDTTARDLAVEDYLKGSQGFSLGKVPTRAALFDDGDSSVLAFQVHHSQYDGWSLPIILHDLQVAYEMFVNMANTGWSKLTTPYSHFVKWSHSQDKVKALKYWKSQLAGASLPSWPKVPLFNVRKGAVTDQSLVCTWPDGKAIVDFCAVRRITMSSFVRAAVAVVLGMHENSEDVMFGVVVSGRGSDIQGIENVVGSCISTLPCRVRLPRDASLMSVIQAVHEQSVDSTPFHFVGLSDIIQESSYVGTKDIFKVLLTIENLPGLHETEHPFLGTNLRGHWLEMNYPLAISVFPSSDNSELRCHLQWDSECLSPADVKWIQTHLFSVFRTMLEHTQVSLADSNFLSPEEKDFVLNVGVGLEPDPATADYTFFHHMVDEAASRNPNHIAVEHISGSVITYGDLVLRANQVARGLQSRGVRPEVAVPVLFDKNQNQIEAVISILAIMKAGGAFVPLDCTWPVDRLLSCIRQIEAKFLICDTVTLDVTSSLIIPTETVETLSEGQAVTPPDVPDLQPDSLSYLMFTRCVVVRQL